MLILTQKYLQTLKQFEDIVNPKRTEHCERGFALAAALGREGHNLQAKQVTTHDEAFDCLPQQ